MGAHFGEAEFVDFAAGLDGELEGDGHSNWIAGDGDGGVDEHGVGTEFHGFGGVAGDAEPGIDDDGDDGLLDDDADLVAGDDFRFRPVAAGTCHLFAEVRMNATDETLAFTFPVRPAR